MQAGSFAVWESSQPFHCQEQMRSSVRKNNTLSKKTSGWISPLSSVYCLQNNVRSSAELLEPTLPIFLLYRIGKVKPGEKKRVESEPPSRVDCGTEKQTLVGTCQ